MKRMELSVTDVRKEETGEGLEEKTADLVLDIFHLGYLLNFPVEIPSR